ncbi:MAG: hypothetical protein QF670_03150 [Alphaproteobacteria bacterium]|jgi:hypothetical protein|nr:hypothetical protein [Alphaproteobacteria bacterium]|tara:strand:- start:83 stop:409 length:327 start_codon:yes stop_codon:yes gene_type:complete
MRSNIASAVPIIAFSQSTAAGKLSRRLALCVKGRTLVFAGRACQTRAMFVCLAFGLCLLVGPAAAGFQGHGGYVKAVALALDGRRGLSGDPDMLLRYWSLETDEELRP